MRMRMDIQIRFDVLGTSVGGVVIPRGADTALVDGAVPPGSSTMWVVVVRMMVVVGTSARS
jgi:hypothetical protein